MKTGDKEHMLILETMAGAGIGVDVIAVIQMLSLVSLDLPLTLAVYGFAASIPLLTAFLVNLLNQDNGVILHDAWYNEFLFIGGLITSAGSVAMLFWHTSSAAGYVFMVASLIALATTLLFLLKVRKAGKHGNRKGQ